jgi:hypothetical protein
VSTDWVRNMITLVVILLNNLRCPLSRLATLYTLNPSFPLTLTLQSSSYNVKRLSGLSST